MSKYKIEESLWYCDNCNACLNLQPGFDFDCEEWECTECGHVNEINEDEIVDDEDFDEIADEYYSDEDDDEDDDED